VEPISLFVRDPPWHVKRETGEKGETRVTGLSGLSGFSG